MDRSQVLGLMVAQLHGWGLAEAAESLAAAVGDDTATEPSNDLSALLSAAAATVSNDVPMPSSMPIAAGPSGAGLDLDAAPSAPVTTASYDPVFVSPTRGISSSAAFSPDGNTFVTGSEDASIKVLQLVPSPPGEPSKWILHKTLFDHTAIVNEIAFHPNGHVLASASDDGCVRFFDLAKGYQKRGFRFFQDATQVKSVSFHPSGDFLLIGTQHPTFRIVDVHTLKCYTAQDPKELHSGPITRVRFAATGLVFATASMDGTIRVYDTVTSKQVQVLTIGCPVSSIEFSKNSKYILSCSADSIGRLWDLSTGQVRVQYHGAMQAMGNTTFNFSQSETLIIGADENSYAIMLWDAVSGKVVKKLAGQSGKTRAFAVSPTRDMFVSCSDDGKAKVWECLP